MDLSGQVYCKACLEARMHRPARAINGFLRFVLSAVPGLGHLYMGLFNRGLQLMVGTVGGIFIFKTVFSPLLGLLIPMLIFYSIFDAREAHMRMAQGLEVADEGFVDIKNLQLTWNSRYVAYGLIGFGALALYNAVVHDLMQVLLVNHYAMYSRVVDAINGVTLGAISVAAGLWLLKRNARDSSH